MIGAFAAVATAVVVTQAEMVLSTIKIGYLQLPPVALGFLLIFMEVSRLARRAAGRFGLNRAELLIIYIMSLVSAMVSSHGVAQKLVPMLVIPNYFANADNHWDKLFGLHTPKTMVPYVPSGSFAQPISQLYYEKLGRGMPLPWQAWVTPLIAWGVLIILVLFAFLCLAALLRRPWADHEKLAFPLAQLPIQMTADNDRSLFTRPGLGLGALIPVVLYAVNGLHQNLPVVPSIPLTFLVNDYLTVSPWSQLYYTPILLSFAAIGFFYLLPVDILFSIWFFFVLSRLGQIGCVSANVAPSDFAASLKFQTVGAYCALTAMLVWSSRRYWKDVWLAAIGRGELGDDNELLPYRVAVWGLLGSIALSAAWLVCMGMSPWLAVFELFVCLFLIAPVMERSTAEAGLLMTETTFRPVDIYSMVAPLHTLGMTNLTMISFFDSMFLRDQRGLLLTGFLDALRVSDAGRIRRRSLLTPLVIAVTVSLVVAVGMNVVLPYKIGALNMDHWMEREGARSLFVDDAAIMNGSSLPVLPLLSGGSAIFGLVVTGLLFLMRSTFFWWPLHPLGYALVGTWSTTEFWFPCLVAWVLKSLTLRYGGPKLFTKATPFFLGMVVGEFGMAVLFVLLNVVFHLQAPPFPWS